MGPCYTGCNQDSAETSGNSDDPGIETGWKGLEGQSRKVGWRRAVQKPSSAET